MLSPCTPTQTAKQAQGQEKKETLLRHVCHQGRKNIEKHAQGTVHSYTCTKLLQMRPHMNSARWTASCSGTTQRSLPRGGRDCMRASSALRGGHHILEGVEGLGSGVGVEGVHALEQGIGHSTVDEAGKAVVDVHDGVLRHGGDHAAQGC